MVGAEEPDICACPLNAFSLSSDKAMLNYCGDKIFDIPQNRKHIASLYSNKENYSRPILNEDAFYSLLSPKHYLSSSDSLQLENIINLPITYRYENGMHSYTDAIGAYATEELGGEPVGNSTPLHTKQSADLAQIAFDYSFYPYPEQEKSFNIYWNNWNYNPSDIFTPVIKSSKIAYATQSSNPWLQVIDNYDWDDDSSYDSIPSPKPAQDIPHVPECRIDAFDMAKKILIGKGGQALAYLVTLKSNSSNKFIYKAYSRPIEFQRELRTVLFSHPNIIKIGCIVSDKLAVMMPYADGGDLWKGFPRSKYELSEDFIILFSAQLIVATEKMHSEGFLHHDIKPHNLVRFLKSNRIALIDFGLSVPISAAGYRRGTRITMAPEVATIAGYDKAPLHEGLDWWSVGVTIFMLHRAIHLDPSSKSGWGDKDENYNINEYRTSLSDVSESNGILNNKKRPLNDVMRMNSPKLPISNYLPCRINIPLEKRKGQKFEATLTWASIPNTLSPELRSLLKKLLHPDPNRRRFHTQAQMNRLKAHPYFQQINWNHLY